MKLNKRVQLLFVIPIITLSSCSLGSSNESAYQYDCTTSNTNPNVVIYDVGMAERFHFNGYYYELVTEGMRNVTPDQHIGYIYNESTYEKMEEHDDTLIEAIDPDNNIYMYICNTKTEDRDRRMHLFTIVDYDWSEYLLGSMYFDGSLHSVYCRTDTTIIDE